MFRECSVSVRSGKNLFSVWVFLASILVCVLPRPALPATPKPQDLPDNISINLRPVRFQDLPAEVVNVHVGPDDRIWYTIAHTGAGNQDWVKRVIEREFRKESPQIRNAEIVLFEPGGRVWFEVLGWVLLGYDGKEWICPDPDTSKYRVLGSCPNHGFLEARRYNCYRDDTAFFVVGSGILTFRNNAWSRLSPVDGPGSEHAPYALPYLVPEPDQSGVVCLIPSVRTGMEDQLWRWHKGQWSRIVLPKALRTMSIGLVAPDVGGVWLCMEDQNLYFLTFAEDVTTTFTALLTKLSDPSLSIRETATMAMVDMGILADDLAAAALERANEPEVKKRLQTVRASVKPGVGEGCIFKGYRLKGAAILSYKDGVSFIVAREAVRKTGETLGQTLLVSGPAGVVEYSLGLGTVCLGRDTFHAPRGYELFRLEPVLTSSKSLAFLPSTPDRGHLLSLNLKTGRPDGGGGDIPVGWVQATTSDGTLFVRAEESMHATGAGLAVLKPNLRDERVFLENRRTDVHDVGRPCVSRDGTITVVTTNRTIATFDGQTWRELTGLRTSDQIVWADVLQNGVTIAYSEEGWLLITTNEVFRDSDIYRLIATHTNVLFEGDITGKMTVADRSDIITDRGGNVWLRGGPDRYLSVLPAGSNVWIDVSAVLKNIGSQDGAVHYVGAAQCPDSIFVSDLRLLSRKGQSFVGKMEDGRPVFCPVLHLVGIHNRRQIEVYDKTHALWIGGQITEAVSEWADNVLGQVAYEIPDDGEVRVYDNQGWPVFADEDGNLWFGQTPGHKEDEFVLWRKGRPVSNVVIPGASQKTYLMAGGKGSVYAWTDGTICHLRIRKDSPSQYTIAGQYVAKGLEGDVEDVGFGRGGHIVVHCRPTRRQPFASINLIRMPE